MLEIEDIAAEAELWARSKNCLSDQAIVYAGLREVYTRLGLLTQNGEISQKAIAAASYLRADVRNPIDRGVWDTRVHAFVMQMGDPREFIPKVTGTDKRYLK